MSMSIIPAVPLSVALRVFFLLKNRSGACSSQPDATIPEAHTQNLE